MPLDPIDTLQKLIQTPSVNPMGRELSGPTLGEIRLTQLLCEICEGQGWPYRRQPVHPGRDNLLIFVGGNPSPSEGGDLLLWDVHQDTVPVEGMSIDPFAGAVARGRVYGRGACDVKGSMAAMLAALSRLTESIPSASLKTSRNQKRPTIVLACTVNEECGFTGARALSAAWANDSAATVHHEGAGEAHDLEQFFPRLPDAAIVAEPTGFNVVVAHQGQVRWRCHTIGRAAHTSRPDAGANAIYAMAQVVQVIERYHRHLSAAGPNHLLCGRPSVCVSTIRGGVGINTVPDRATIEVDRRLGPSESPTAAYEELASYIAQHADLGRCRIEHDPPFTQGSGLSDEHNRPVAERLANTAKKHGEGGELVGAPYGTDAAAIAVLGVPTVVFGPGSIDQAHTEDEFIEISQLELAVELFYDIACEGLR